MKICFLSLAFLVPMALWLGFFDSVETSKQVILNSCLLLVFLSVVVDGERSGLVCDSPLLVPVLAMVVSVLVSCWASLSPVVSWMGEEGSLTGGALVIPLFLLSLSASIVAAQQGTGRIAAAFVVSALLLAAYSFLQLLGLDPFPWNSALKNRYWIFASLGNPVHLANFMVGAFWLSFCAGFRNSLLAWSVRIVLAVVMVQSGSRTAVVAFLAAWAVHYFLGRRHRAPAVCAGVLSVAVFPVLEPLVRIFSLSRIFGARDAIWEGASRLLAAHPWLGIGPDMLHTLFPSVAGYAFFAAEPPSIAGVVVSLRLPASAHNELMHFAVSQGLLGLGIYAWIIVIVVRLGLRSSMLPALAAVWTMHMTNPSSTATSMFFWILAGLIVGEGMARRPRNYFPCAWFSPRILPAILTLCLVFSTASCLRWAVCQAHKREAGRLLFLNRTDQLMAHSLRWSDFAAGIHPAFASADAGVLRWLWEASPRDEALADRAEELFARASGVNPRNIFFLAGASDLNLERGKILRDRRALDRAESYARRAIEVAPPILSLYDDLAAVLEAKGQRGDAALLRRQRREMDPLGLFAPSSD